MTPEVITNFRQKFNLPDILSVEFDRDNAELVVNTANAKIWVDLPERFSGFYVRMNVLRRRRP